LSASKIKPGLVACFTDEVNAFVIRQDAPIFVTTGLLVRYGHDGEFLAGVLAHEMGHLARSHFDYQARALQTYEAHAQAVAEHDFYRNGNVAHAVAMGKKAFAWNIRAFERRQELDADDFGAQVLAEAGYKPEVMVKVMLRFLGDDGHERTEWFQNHPGWPERLANIEPRILDLELTATLQRLSPDREMGALVSQINLWIEKLPDSGNAWLHKGRVLEQLRRISYVEAYERAVTGQQPTLSGDEAKFDSVWFALCMGLYETGNRLESAYCARNVRSIQLRERLRAATFGDRLWQHGDASPNSLLTARDENGGKFITNQQSSIAFRGLRAQSVVPWRPVRFPPSDADAPIRLQ